MLPNTSPTTMYWTTPDPPRAGGALRHCHSRPGHGARCIERGVTLPFDLNADRWQRRRRRGRGGTTVKHPVRRLRMTALVATFGLIGGGLLAGTAGAQTTDPGITNDTVKVGLISSESGIASST